MPALLLFPSFAWLWDKVRCRKVTTEELFLQTELPSIKREREEEIVIDNYLKNNGIVITE